MRWGFALALALHAAIHALGVVKAFGLAELAQLQIPISRAMGWVWGLAGALLLAAAIALVAAPRAFWVLGALGLVLSQVAVVSSWSDARAGAVANLLLLLGVIYGAAAWGPFGLRADYARHVAEGLASAQPRGPAVTEADLAPLPAAIQSYLRLVGVVGQPRPAGFRVTMRGRIRGGPDAPWMPFEAEQHSFFDPPRRNFWMQASRDGLPVDVLHTYGPDGARMRVRVLSLFPMVDAGGAEFTRTETVTLLNDLCLMAPMGLLDPAISWRELDARTVEASYTVGANTVRATLQFDEAGRLSSFWSDDRPQLAADNVHFTPLRWSTPVSGWQTRGGLTLPTAGEARYAAPTGDYAYAEFEGIAVELLP